MTNQRIIVLDLETQKSFKEVGRSKLEKLKVSVVGIHDSVMKDYMTYDEQDLMDLEKHLQKADLIVGFNIRRFDLPVLAPYLFMPVDQFPVLDLLDDIEAARGHRASLDSVAAPTLKQRKSGSGTEALVLFKQKRFDELKKYCLQDVKLTKEVYEYGCEHGSVKFTSAWDYKTYDIPVTWKEQSERFFQQGAQKESEFPTSLF
ncbi:ribonuclease H-like domain-containing protein [Omnitrophica bacterium]|nr:ribonuclease H-like domain-containing protein [Candidatus Omnitrophota bacterium]